VRTRVAAIVLAAAACNEPPKSSNAVPPPAASASAPVPEATMTVAFCAFGGQGVMPVDASPDDYVRVLAFVVVRAPAAATGVSVSAVDVTGDGGLEASLRKVESVERLASDAKLTAPDVWRSRGAPFDGTLAPGETKLRVEAWITKRPRSRPAELRVGVAGPTLRANATCALAIEWPTG